MKLSSLHKQPARAHLNMRNGLHKVIDSARIRVASLNVILLPVDVVDLTRNVSADDVIFLDFVEGHMGIVYANQNDTGIVRLVDDNAIVELWHWNLSWIVVDVKMVLSCDTANVFQLDDAPCARIYVQIDVTISCKDSGGKI